jgi:ABC-type nitrate/sulfonate/bicarbonate transport system ATPase subunit
MQTEVSNVLAHGEVVLYFSGKAGVSGKTLVKCPDFALRRGHISVLMGPSGSGKTILCKTVAGLIHPLSGRVERKEGALVRLLLQNTRGFPWLTMLENVLLGVTLSGFAVSDSDRKRAAELISEIGLDGHEGKMPGQLSGGMLRRMLIARSLMSAPRILILDEPFAGLDASNRDIIREVLKRLASNTGITILVVTHELADAIDLRAQVWMINEDGMLIRKALGEAPSRCR